MDIINTVKDEILRLADKQAAVQVGKARKAVLQYRKQVAELKRIVRQQEREIKYLKRQVQADEVEPEDTQLQGVRFSAKSVRSQRKRLGLTCEQYAKLVGVSPLTISNWETGKARPRRAQLLALVAVRGISKKAALAKLDR